MREDGKTPKERRSLLVEEKREERMFFSSSESVFPRRCIMRSATVSAIESGSSAFCELNIWVNGGIVPCTMPYPCEHAPITVPVISEQLMEIFTCAPMSDPRNWSGVSFFSPFQ